MKPYWKKYEHELYKRSVLAHFVAQPSKYTQRMHGTSQKPPNPALKSIPLHSALLGDLPSVLEEPGHFPRSARLRWETGRALYAVRMGKPLGIEVIPKLRRMQKLRVIDQLADAIVEHIRLGVVHNDMRPSNIILSGRHRPRIKIVDYARAQIATGNALEAVDLSKDFVDVYHDVIPLLAGRNPKATRRLQGYFERRFLGKIERKL